MEATRGIRITAEQALQLIKLARAVEAHLSAYTSRQEMPESDREMDEALDNVARSGLRL